MASSSVSFDFCGSAAQSSWVCRLWLPNDHRRLSLNPNRCHHPFITQLRLTRTILGVLKISSILLKLSNFKFAYFHGQNKYKIRVSVHYEVCTRVSNGTGQRNFSRQRDSQNFFVPGQRDNGTEDPSLSRDKGTTGQAQNLAMGRDGPGQPKSGTGRAGTAKLRDGTRDKTGQSRKRMF